MNAIILSLFYGFALLYLLLIILVVSGLLRLRRKTGTKRPAISVVISARNEENRIQKNLAALEKLNYPPEKYEIIFVDDASVDNTAALISSYVGIHDNWRLIRLKESERILPGKKAALKRGIDSARHDLIFTTDADCAPPPDWLKVMSAYFDDNTAMVIGHSPLVTGKSFFSRILAFDNLFSAIVGAAPAKLGFPHTSVGRNLAYRKEAYRAVGGYAALKQFKSGDDVHLTERFRKAKLGKIDYCAHPATFVETYPPATAKEIFHQQIRKNSKTLKKSLPSVLISLALFAAYMVFLFLPLLDFSLFPLWIKIMIFKFAAEFFTLTFAACKFEKTKLIPWLPLMQLIYPIYIIFFSLLGVLQIYQWKK